MSEKCQCREDCGSLLSPSDLTSYQYCSDPECDKIIAKNSNHHNFPVGSLSWFPRGDLPLQFCYQHCHCCNPQHPHHHSPIVRETRTAENLQLVVQSGSEIIEVL
jgi:hypothetical protein